MSDNHTMKNIKIKATLLSSNIDVEVDIRSSFKTLLSFSFAGRSYVGEITKWRSTGQTMFLNYFLSYYNDKQKFGYRDEENGEFKMTLEQKTSCVIQGVQDVFNCIDKIITQYQRQLLDYAVYYRENCHYKDYSTYITTIACHLIVHMNLMVPNINYKIVTF